VGEDVEVDREEMGGDFCYLAAPKPALDDCIKGGNTSRIRLIVIYIMMSD